MIEISAEEAKRAMAESQKIYDGIAAKMAGRDTNLLYDMLVLQYVIVLMMIPIFKFAVDDKDHSMPEKMKSNIDKFWKMVVTGERPAPDPENPIIKGMH